MRNEEPNETAGKELMKAGGDAQFIFQTNFRRARKRTKRDE